MDEPSSTIVRRRQGGARVVVAPHLFLVLQGERPLGLYARYSLRDLKRVDIGRAPRSDGRWLDDQQVPALERDGGEDAQAAIKVADHHMSTKHIVVERAGEGWTVRDAQSTNGTCVNGHDLDETPRALHDGDLIEAGSTFFIFRSAVPEADSELPSLFRVPGASAGVAFATFSSTLARTLTALEDDVATLLITGPTGSGKEVAARAIHALSRRPGEFVAVNVAAIPGELLEAELFGNARNYPNPGMDERKGIIREAAGGTLLLDEIGEMRLDLQAKLLRVIRERTVRPLGGRREEQVDVRWVAATNQDLAALVRQGRFREDLYSRIGTGTTVKLPPLIERREDIGLLIAALLRRLGAAATTFEPGAARALLLHTWPMNIGELHNCIESACRKARGGVIVEEYLPDSVRAALSRAGGAASERQALPTELGRRDELLALAEAHAGNVVQMSRAAGVPRSTLQKHLKRHGIDVAAIRRRPP